MWFHTHQIFIRVSCDTHLVSLYRYIGDAFYFDSAIGLHIVHLHDEYREITLSVSPEFYADQAPGHSADRVQEHDADRMRNLIFHVYFYA